MQPFIAAALHGIWIGGPLGVDVEHKEAIKTIGQGDALHGLEGCRERSRAIARADEQADLDGGRHFASTSRSARTSACS